MADDSMPSRTAGSVMPFDPNMAPPPTADLLANGGGSEIDPDLDGFDPSPADEDAQLMTAETIQQRVASSRRSTVQYDVDALPAYRSPEPLPVTPPPASPLQTSAIVQEIAPSPSSWSNKADNDPTGGGGGGFMELDELAAAAAPQVGHGLLPTAFLTAPLWPPERRAWEVAIVGVPPRNLPPKPTAPTSPTQATQSMPGPAGEAPTADAQTGGSSSTTTAAALLPTSSSSQSLASTSKILAAPPTVEDVRASLPQRPEGVQKGAVMFDTARWAWWIVPAGDDGSPPEHLLTASGASAVRKLATELSQSRTGASLEPDDVRCPWWIRVPDEEFSPALPERSLLGPPPLDQVSSSTAPAPSSSEQGMLVDVESIEVASADPALITPPPSPPAVSVAQTRPAPLIPDQLFISATDMRWLILPGEPAVRGVLNPDVVHEFVQTRAVDPPAGVRHGGEAALVVLLTMISNTVFSNDQRAIKVTNKNFASRVRWDALSEQIFVSLGFTIHDQTDAEPSVLIAPPKEEVAWLQVRARLMRAWVELSIFLEEYRYEDPQHHPPASDTPAKHSGLVQKLEPRDHAFGSAVGALKDKIPRMQLAGDKSAAFELARTTLGLNPVGFTVPAAYVSFAYRMQARFDGKHVARYLQALSDTAAEWSGVGQEDLQILLVQEQSKGLNTQKALDDAYEAFPGLKKKYADDVLMMEQEDMPTDYLVKCFGDEFQELSRRHAAGSEELSTAKSRLIDQFEIIATSRRDDAVAHAQLQEAVLQARREPMDPAEAYRVLGAAADTDDFTLQTLFEIRLMDDPGRMDRYKDALRSIADVRDSKLLRSYADTGVRSDAIAVEAPLPVSADIPVGLNNIGNTCYLNSLLQYFYTLSELRQIIAQADQFKEDLQALPSKAAKRVGGRVVSRKEIERSIRFIDLLGSLFMNLEYSATASIEPERELAYLALVTPQDEAAEVTDPEPAVAGHLPTDAERTSTDTDVTLVDDAIVPAVQSPSAVRPRLMSSTSSVLGKRSSEDRDDPMLGEQVTSPSVYRNAFRTDSAMSERSDVTTEPTPPPSPVLSPTSAKSPRQEHQDSIRRATREMTIEPEAGLLQRAPDEAGPPDADVPQVPLETPRPGPPPLPPRRTSAKKPFMADAAGGGAMMFGKQHDVSECLDNCLFQIDAALDSAKLQKTNEHADSVVKDLFFGKARQVITFDEAGSKPDGSHDQEVIFNHLLLNVGDTGTSKDLHDSLAEYYTPEPVEIAGKPALMREVPVAYPALLHFQLQRAQFDRQTGRAYKSNAFLDLPQELALDRYLCPADDDKAIQTNGLTRQIKVLRDRIHALQQPRGTSVESSLLFLHDDVFGSADWLPPSAIDDELRADLVAQRTAVLEEVTAAEAEIVRLKSLVEDLWRDSQSACYTLTSVFMHRGDTGFGHYWLYQRNVPHHPEEWFKYNDSTVTKVPPEEVLSATGTNATAYLAVYQRADRPGLVDTVHRTLA